MARLTFEQELALIKAKGEAERAVISHRGHTKRATEASRYIHDRAEFGHRPYYPVLSVCFSPDGKTLVSGFLSFAWRTMR